MLSAAWAEDMPTRSPRAIMEQTSFMVSSWCSPGLSDLSQMNAPEATAATSTAKATTTELRVQGFPQTSAAARCGCGPSSWLRGQEVKGPGSGQGGRVPGPVRAFDLAGRDETPGTSCD